MGQEGHGLDDVTVRGDDNGRNGVEYFLETRGGVLDKEMVAEGGIDGDRLVFIGGPHE